MTHLPCAIVVALSLCSTSLGDVVRFTFRGTINELTGPVASPWDSIVVGDHFRMTYYFDSTTTDVNPSFQYGDYFEAIHNGRIVIAGIGVELESGDIQVYNGSNDDYLASLDLAGGTMAEIFLRDTFETALEGDELPIDLEFEYFTDFFLDVARLIVFSGVESSIIGEITSFESSVVPSPAAIGLLLVGMTWQSGRRRR